MISSSEQRSLETWGEQESHASLFNTIPWDDNRKYDTIHGDDFMLMIAHNISS